MSSTGIWDEVKRLAADFQRAQLSSTNQKLSERNCVELVKKLGELQLIEVIYTTDGRTYITPQHLLREVRDEVEVHSGRVALSDISQALNVDFSHVEGKANDLVKQDRSLHLVLGQLIHRDYLDRIGEEINDRLQEAGQVKMGELAKEYDLPTDFITEVVSERLGTGIQGQRDPNDPSTIFTASFIDRHRARIRGIFSAITRPTSISKIFNSKEFQQKLFFSLLEELLSSGRLCGSLNGGKQQSAMYVPDLYTRAQNNWLQDFYAQNGYIEYASVTRLGFGDAEGVCKRKFKEALALSTCCVGPGIVGSVQAAVDEALAAGSWVDVMPLVPTTLSEGDATALLTQCLKGRSDSFILADSIAVSKAFVTSCHAHFSFLLTSRAQEALAKNPRLLAEADSASGASASSAAAAADDDKKADRRKKAAEGKAGGGAQGRETKTKSVKKKGGKGSKYDDQEDADPAPRKGQVEIPFMTSEEVQGVLEKAEPECPEELLEAVAQHLRGSLISEYQSVLRTVYLNTSASGADRRRSHKQLADQLLSLAANMALFEKAIPKLPVEETQQHLSRHLLRTLGTDLTNLIVLDLVAEHRIDHTPDNQLSIEARADLISKLPDPARAFLMSLHAALNKSTVEDFWTSLEKVCSNDLLGILLKKSDKKKERQLAFAHRQSVGTQLRAETEAAAQLHMAVSLLFQSQTGTPVLAPGRCVPALLDFIAPQLDEEVAALLRKTQDLVMSVARQQQQEGGEASTNDLSELQDLLPRVQEAALAKKQGASAAE